MSIVGVDYNKNAIFRQTGKIHKVVVVGYFGVNEEGEEEKKTIHKLDSTFNELINVMWLSMRK